MIIVDIEAVFKFVFSSQQRQRDVLLSVLKLVTMQRQGSLPPPPMPPITGFPLPTGPEAPPPTQRVSPLMFPPGAGPGHLSISPVPPQARVPSPQEMTVLTQQIMQVFLGYFCVFLVYFRAFLGHFRVFWEFQGYF